MCRSDQPISDALKRKISLLCDVPIEAVISAVDARSIYEIPLVLREQGLDGFVCRTLGIPGADQDVDLSEWESLVHRVESLRHAGFHFGARITLDWIDAEQVTDLLETGRIRELDGIVIPGGFGERGVEGMIAAAGHARQHAIPCLGLCLGLQVMVIDVARNLAGLEGANSREFDSLTPHPVIDLMEEQVNVTDKGGTMRLGAYVAKLLPGSKVAGAYATDSVTERHRHRYEVNSRYRARLEAAGLVCSGISPDNRLVEFVELAGHPYWLGTQAHPEFKSRPDRPHPLFRELVAAALDRAEGREPRLIGLTDLDPVH